MISSRIKYFLIIFAIIFVATVCGVGFVSYNILRRLAYSEYTNDHYLYGKPMRLLAKDQRVVLRKDYSATDVSFTSADNITLSGMIIERKNPDKLVVLCHGYHCCKELMSDHIKLFPKSTILLFDFRAHGKSGGKITTIGLHEHLDVIAATTFLKDKYKDLIADKKIPVVLLGMSMGGAASIKAFMHDKDLCDALIVDSSYSDLEKMIKFIFASKAGLPRFPFLTFTHRMFVTFFGNKGDLYEMRPIEYIGKIEKPIFLIHSCSDDFTIAQHSIDMYKKIAHKRSKIWIGPPAVRHGALCNSHYDMYEKKVDSFLKKYL